MRFLVLTLVLSLTGCLAKKEAPAKKTEIAVGAEKGEFKILEEPPALEIDLCPDAAGYDIAASSDVGPDISLPAPALLKIDLAPITQKVQAQEDKTQAMAKKVDGLDKQVQEIQRILEEKRRTLSPSAYRKWRKERADFLMR